MSSKSLSKWAIVILNWNSARDVVQLVNGLDSRHRDRVLLVDNASEDWPREQTALLALEAPLTIVRRDSNGGYGSGMNTGVRHAARAGAQWAILLNADSRPTSGQIDAICERFPGPAMVGIQQFSPSVATEAPGADIYPTAAVVEHRRLKEFTCLGCSAAVHQVDVVSGAVIAVDVGRFLAVGGFDERYFHYKEEIDLCLRLGRRGKIEWLCYTKVEHRRGGSMPQASAAAMYYRTRNEFLFRRKREGALGVIHPLLWADVVHHGRRAARDGTLRGWLQGLWDGSRGVTGQMPVPRKPPFDQ